MRDDVVGKLEGELLNRRFLAGTQLGILAHQFVHGCRTGAARRLIGRYMHARDVREVLDGVQCHDHLDRRAVRVGDDPPGSPLRILGIHLRHHKRHILVHAEGARVVDHHGPVLGDRLRELARRAGTGRSEHIIDALEIVVVLQQLDRKGFATEHILAAGAALRAEQQQLVDGELTLLQNLQELLSHGAAGAHDSNSHLSYIPLIKPNLLAFPPTGEIRLDGLYQSKKASSSAIPVSEARSPLSCCSSQSYSGMSVGRTKRSSRSMPSRPSS